MSAVSKSVHPTSSAASTRRRALARSPPPKRHIPHPRGATARPLFPSGMRVSAEGTRLITAHSNIRSEEHTSELQSPMYLVCRLLLEKKKKKKKKMNIDITIYEGIYQKN